MLKININTCASFKINTILYNVCLFFNNKVKIKLQMVFYL